MQPHEHIVGVRSIREKAMRVGVGRRGVDGHITCLNIVLMRFLW